MDLIVAYQGRDIAIQVKRSVSPVGIQGVQEVAAGARHYACDEAALICDTGFTKSAEGLAATTGVHLIIAADSVHLEQQVESFLGGEKRTGKR